MSTNEREIEDICARYRRGELITRAECEQVVSQFHSPAGQTLYNPQVPIDPKYLDGTMPGILSWPPSRFKDDSE